MTKGRLVEIELMANYGRDVAITPVEMAFRIVVPELGAALRQAWAERDALAVEREKAKALLRVLEWDSRRFLYCWSCHALQPDGHKPDCALAAVLR